MFTAYVIDSDGHEDGHLDLESFADALRFLRNVIEDDMLEPHGVFPRYGLAFDGADAPEVMKFIMGLGVLKTELAQRPLDDAFPQVPAPGIEYLHAVVNSLPNESADPDPQQYRWFGEG